MVSGSNTGCWQVSMETAAAFIGSNVLDEPGTSQGSEKHTKKWAIEKLEYSFTVIVLRQT